MIRGSTPGDSADVLPLTEQPAPANAIPPSLLTRLEELSRWREGAQGRYRDAIGALPRIKGATNHIILGRRGSGKTRLLDELKRSAESAGDYVISIGAEDHKELTYPDILIQILRTFLREFDETLRPPTQWSAPWWTDVRQRLRHPFATSTTSRERATLVTTVRQLSRLLEDLLAQSEQLTAVYSTQRSHAHEQRSQASVALSPDSMSIGAGTQAVTAEEKNAHRVVSQREWKRDKVERQLLDFKHLLRRVSAFLGGNIFLCVDDFYFIRMDDQPPVADYIHRICKDSRAFLKIATIRHRSALYRRGELIRGVVFGHEVQIVDLDLPLGQFDAVTRFLEGIWQEVCRETETHPAGIFKGEGFSQAVLASGGVPRDLFGVIKSAANLAGIRGESAIGKIRVNEAARSYTEDTKYPELFEDSSDGTLIQLLIMDIVRFVRDEQRRNCFHINLDELEKKPKMRALVEAIVDGRLIHLISDNTTNARRAGRYAAYLLDVGLYAHPQRRGDRAIEEVKFWETDRAGRLKNLERSPVYRLRNVEDLARAVDEGSSEGLGKNYLFPASGSADEDAVQLEIFERLLPSQSDDNVIDP